MLHNIRKLLLIETIRFGKEKIQIGFRSVEFENEIDSMNSDMLVCLYNEVNCADIVSQNFIEHNIYFIKYSRDKIMAQDILFSFL